jgi:glycerol uptake facilitator protein
MNPFFGELIGIALLILLGNGVVSNVVLTKPKGTMPGNRNGYYHYICRGWQEQ